MQFTVALVSLVTVATAASVPRQSDPHMIDFRSYGAAGCFAENQGVYTYEQSDAGTCIEYPSELDVESILLVDITIDGCSFYTYADAGCATEAIPIVVGECYNATAGPLGSFQTICS